MDEKSVSAILENGSASFRFGTDIHSNHVRGGGRPDECGIDVHGGD